MTDTSDWTENRKKAATNGIGYYTCERCGKNNVDVCGHACIGYNNSNMSRLCGEMPASYWEGKKEETGIIPKDFDIPPTTTTKTDWLPPPPPPVQKPVSLLIGLPMQGQTDTEWALNYAHNILQKQLPPNTQISVENRYGIAQSREAIINNFIKSNCTHLLFLDTDIMPVENHGITTLINDTLLNPKIYMVTGCYYNSLYTGLAAWKDGAPLNFNDPNNIINTSKDPVIEVDTTGMGLYVFKRELFDLIEDMDRPLFFYKILEGNTMQSEDFYFQKRLSGKYGIKPYIDNRVTALHIKRCKINVKGQVSF